MMVSSSKAAETLLERGRSFLASAKANLERGLYDVACFEVDQAVQLTLKAHIQIISGSVPRTHSIRNLLATLGMLTKREQEVDRFVSELRGELIALEDSYLRARYAAEPYSKEDAELCIRLAEKVVKFAESLFETT